ncbi:MAG: hypothetical protein NVS9B1_14600 [Candidatus Dormibacteraceae bacterium]
MVKDERRQSLRRLDDLLDALEQLNLSEQPEPTPAIAARLAELAVPVAARSISQLIDSVLDLQAEFLIKVQVERRKTPRRRTRLDIGRWLRKGSEPRP